MSKDFSASIQAYGTALKLISELKLWKYFFVPAVIGLTVGLGIMAVAYTMSDNIGEYLTSWYPFEFGKSALEWIANLVGGLIVLVFGVLIYRHIVMALSAPFMAPLSEKIEIHYNGKLNQPGSSFSVLLLRGIRVSLRNLLLELLISIPLLLCSFIPLINIFTGILLLYTQSYYAGFGNMDYTLERYGKYKTSVIFVRQNKGLAVGNGLIFILMLLIPFVGIMLTLPVSTAAATVVTLERIKTIRSKNKKE